MKRKIGITTTIPSEVVFAADAAPIDLNNIFVSYQGEEKIKTPADLIRLAEDDGLPRNTCSWIKGIYGALKVLPEIKEVVVVVQGDCSNAVALADILKHKKYEVISFAYPRGRDGEALKQEMERFMRRFGVRRRAVDAEKKKLDKIRKKLNKLDELTWRENRLSGFENHLYLVSASDFQSNPEAFEKKVTHLINESRQRTPMEQAVRLGYVGVPPIVSDLYTYLESLGGRVVFNEVQSQFAMLEQTDDIIEQYMIYTYPYDVFGRLADINAEIEERSINGIIHYVQSFCHHQIDGLLLQKEISVPVLTLECDRPGTLDLRNKLRLEAFVGMLKK